jgi:hypothetical protein
MGEEITISLFVRNVPPELFSIREMNADDPRPATISGE